MNQRIVFLCPHGAAKSVMAAAYCQRLAKQWDIPVQITSAGTEPDAELAPAVVALLRAEGIDVVDQRPRRVTAEELAAASCIVSMGCDLGDVRGPAMTIEHWNDVPSPSLDLSGAWDRIQNHVEQLVAVLKRTEDRVSKSGEGMCG